MSAFHNQILLRVLGIQLPQFTTTTVTETDNR